MMNGQNRSDMKVGATVKIVLKADQFKSFPSTIPNILLSSGAEGIVARLLTKSSFHPHGIKVMLENGQVGRVQEIVE